MATLAPREGSSPASRTRAMRGYPSEATFRRIQRSVSCASSKLSANNRKLLDSLPTATSRQTLLNSGPITPKPPELIWRPGVPDVTRSEEHTSELQSNSYISYAV